MQLNLIEAININAIVLKCVNSHGIDSDVKYRPLCNSSTMLGISTKPCFIWESSDILLL